MINPCTGLMNWVTWEIIKKFWNSTFPKSLAAKRNLQKSW